MNYNLPTGPGYSTVSPVSLQYVKDVYNEEPLDAGAGKIKKLDSKIFDYLRMYGVRPNWQNLEADWVITKNSLYYINPNAVIYGRHGCYPFPFTDWGLVFGKNRGYGIGKAMAALSIISRKNKNLSFILKTSNSAQQNISYIFNKFEE